MSLAEAIARRRSVRRYGRESLPLSHLSKVLWAAQGITDTHGLRAAPSAGATYPLEVFVLIGRHSVDGVDEGLYHYNVESHSLHWYKGGDLRRQLSIAALDQEFIAEAPVDIVICALYERTSWRYGKRAERYVHMEVGHVGENIHLQAVALGLAAVVVGAFSDEDVSRAMELGKGVNPLYIISVGKPR
jgi:SagB-type dehydrogenase family enzyme